MNIPFLSHFNFKNNLAYTIFIFTAMALTKACWERPKNPRSPARRCKVKKNTKHSKVSCAASVQQQHCLRMLKERPTPLFVAYSIRYEKVEKTYIFPIQ